MRYFNRNFNQELDVPIGPDNKIEPGAADQRQPTHFIPRRQWGAFAVRVSKDVERRLDAENKTVTWTLRANGQTVTIPANIRILPLKRDIGVTLTWVRHRGVGEVTITDTTKSVDGNGDATVTAIFAEPGEYVLRVEASDTESHDFHCCWSNGFIRATVGGRR